MKKYLFIVLGIVLLCTGCFKRDSMEDITIYTSVYPIEYITTRLYGDNAEISSIYPNGIIVDKYTLTEKQLDDYSKADLFIFNGLSSEKDYIKPMFSKNKNLKIIDATSSIEYENKNGTITEEFQQRKAVEVLKEAVEIVKGGGIDGN